jgi:hypothetical protein
MVVIYRHTTVPTQPAIFLSSQDKLRTIGGKEYLYKYTENKTYVCIQRPIVDSGTSSLPCSTWQETDRELPTLIKQEQIIQQKTDAQFKNYWEENGVYWLLGSLVVLVVLLVVLLVRR